VDDFFLCWRVSKSSWIGTGIEEIDLINIRSFAARVVKLAEYRKHLHDYLVQRMNSIAPNLSALLGEQVSARLIAHAGSLTNLAKYPASTVQILGAEKALFRALKTKGKTPKYGLLFHSSFIGKAKQKNKGRISRYLANKCSIASRIDCFSDVATDVFGRTLREQVEERLRFYETGSSSQKNSDVMKKAIDELSSIVKQDHEDKMEVEEKKKKEDEEEDAEHHKEHKKKKDKKKKESRKDKSHKKTDKIEKEKKKKHKQHS